MHTHDKGSQNITGHFQFNPYWMGLVVFDSRTHVLSSVSGAFSFTSTDDISVFSAGSHSLVQNISVGGNRVYFNANNEGAWTGNRKFTINY